MDRVVRRGAERAVRCHRKLRAPLLYWVNGEVVEVDPWSVELPMVDPTDHLPPPEEAHQCEELIAALKGYEDLCEYWGPAGRGSDGPLLWGKAVKRIERRRDRWWAHNGEYAIAVRYCPFCGTVL
jgi:hypothetical protein